MYRQAINVYYMKVKISKRTNIYEKISELIKSNLFFKLSLIIYFINSAWIAVSALYPMAFDEQYHLGIIRLYSDKLTPFWSANPNGEAVYGAVARDPSYIYHYLLSFPYRIIELLFRSEMLQVLVLRFINILIFGFGIWIFRKVLLNSKVSKIITNSVLLVFILTPLTTLLAAQINYDNLLFLILALLLLKTQNFTQQVKATKQFNPRDFITIAIMCIFGSLVKYAFLPIALAVVVYLFFYLTKYLNYKKSIPEIFIKPFMKYQLVTKVVLVLGFLVMFGLFSERYVINTIKYKTPTPECNQVLSVDECLAYGPWRRNYYTHKAKVENKLEKIYSNSFPRYLVTLWISQSTYQLFFTIDGATHDFKVGEAYRINRNGSIILFSVGSLLFLAQYHRVRKKYIFGMFYLVMFLYLLALIAQNYLDFVNLGYPFAIQGRYLVPILPILYTLFGVSFNMLLKKYDKVKISLISGLFLIMITQGGGAGTFILRSSDAWYWQKTYPKKINHYARNVLKPLTIEQD